jgi:broad specificity phosphatase PhoE
MTSLKTVKEKAKKLGKEKPKPQKVLWIFRHSFPDWYVKPPLDMKDPEAKRDWEERRKAAMGLPGNPGLGDDGVAITEHLADTLELSGIKVIYQQGPLRHEQTAQAVAKRLGVPVKEVADLERLFCIEEQNGDPPPPYKSTERLIEQLMAEKENCIGVCISRPTISDLIMRLTGENIDMNDITCGSVYKIEQGRLTRVRHRFDRIPFLKARDREY